MIHIRLNQPKVWLTSHNLQRTKSLGSLPYDLVRLIFSHLNEMDIEQASKVNKSWNVTTVAAAKTLKLVPLKSFIEWLIGNLDNKFYHHKKWLIVALNETKILETVNLLQVKSCKGILSEKILHILNDIGADDLVELESLYKKKHAHSPFENFFTLAEIYKRFENKLSLSEICCIFRSLVRMDASDKALEIFNRIIKNSTVDNFYLIDWKIKILLNCLFEELVLKGKFTKALGLIIIYSESLSNKFITRLFCDIINSPTNFGLNLAMQASITLLKKPVDDYLERAILSLFKKSCELAQTTPDFSTKYPVFVTFFEELLFCNEPTSRLAAHDNIEQIPDTILFETFQNTLEKENIVEAGKIATGLTDPLLESKAVEALEEKDPSWPHLGSF